VSASTAWQPRGSRERCGDPAGRAEERTPNHVGTMAAHPPRDAVGEKPKIRNHTFALAPTQGDVGRGIGHKGVRQSERVVTVARPWPISRATHHARPDRIQVAVQHHLEFASPTVLNPGRPETLHHDLAAAPGPAIGPSSEALVDHLPEGAERHLAPDRSADHVRVGAHEAVAADLDSVSVLVFPQKSEEFPSGIVGGENGRSVVAPPEAVMGRSKANKARSREARHEPDGSKPRAEKSRQEVR